MIREPENLPEILQECLGVSAGVDACSNVWERCFQPLACPGFPGNGMDWGTRDFPMPGRCFYRDEVKLGAVLECSPDSTCGDLEGFFFVEGLVRNVATETKPRGKLSAYGTRRS